MEPTPAREDNNAGGERRVAQHLLKEEREDGDRDVNRESEHEDQETADGKVPVPQHAQVNERVAGAPAVADEPEQRDAEDHRGPANPHGPVPVVLLAFIEDDLQAAGPQNQQAEAEVVELARLGVAHIRRIVDIAADHVDRQRADGDVDVERIAPAIGVGQPAAKRRAKDRRNHDAESEQRHGSAALGRRKTLQQDRLRERLQRSSARALQHTREQQEPKRWSRSAKEGCDGEQHDARQQEPFAAEPQPEPVARGKDDGIGDQIAGEHPCGFGVGRGQRASNIRQRHRGDRGVQHLHERRQHDGDSDNPGI